MKCLQKLSLSFPSVTNLYYLWYEQWHSLNTC